MAELTMDRPPVRPVPTPAPAPTPVPRPADPEAGALLASTYAVVLAGGRGTRLCQLTDACAKPAMPFGGAWRIVDFALSNCINSGIRRVGVLTQYKSQSLIRHVTRAWGGLDARLGEGVDIVPAQQRTGAGWYSGTADAVFQNLDLLQEAGARHVLVLAGDHVYKMDYRRMLAEHLRRGADASVACIEVPVAEASAFGVMAVDDDGRIVAFDEKPARPRALPGRPDTALVSMGIYLFDAALLAAALQRDAADARSRHDFGADVLPALLARARVFAHDAATSCLQRGGMPPYWRDVGTLDAYWRANLDLTQAAPALDLHDAAWPIRSLAEALPPAQVVGDERGRAGVVVDSLLAGGSVVAGATVRGSVLFANARVGSGSLVEESLLLPGAVVGRNVVLRRAVVDQRCVLPDGIRIGVCAAEDRAHFTVSDGGVTLVTPEMLGAARR